MLKSIPFPDPVLSCRTKGLNEGNDAKEMGCGYIQEYLSRFFLPCVRARVRE